MHRGSEIERGRGRAMRGDFRESGSSFRGDHERGRMRGGMRGANFR